MTWDADQGSRVTQCFRRLARRYAARPHERREGLQARTEGRGTTAALRTPCAVRDGDRVRDIYRRQWTGLRTRELVESAIADLMPLGWVRRLPYLPKNKTAFWEKRGRSGAAPGSCRDR